MQNHIQNQNHSLAKLKQHQISNKFNMKINTNTIDNYSLNKNKYYKSNNEYDEYDNFDRLTNSTDKSNNDHNYKNYNYRSKET